MPCGALSDTVSILVFTKFGRTLRVFPNVFSNDIYNRVSIFSKICLKMEIENVSTISSRFNVRKLRSKRWRSPDYLLCSSQWNAYEKSVFCCGRANNKIYWLLEDPLWHTVDVECVLIILSPLMINAQKYYFFILFFRIFIFFFGKSCVQEKHYWIYFIVKLLPL